jgi:hypothetical protein
MIKSSQELFFNFLSEILWGKDLHTRSVAENIKDQLTGITVRKTQLTRAILQPASLLVGMPLLGSEPVGALGGKSKGGCLVRRAGKETKVLSAIRT